MNKSVKIILLMTVVLLAVIIGFGIKRIFLPDEVSLKAKAKQPENNNLSLKRNRGPEIRAKTEIIKNSYYFPQKKKAGKVNPQEYKPVSTADIRQEIKNLQLASDEEIKAVPEEEIAIFYEQKLKEEEERSRIEAQRGVEPELETGKP